MAHSEGKQIFIAKSIKVAARASAFVISWCKAGGNLSIDGDNNLDDFRDWMRSIGLSEDEISEALACHREKMALLESAEAYLDTIQKR